MKMEDAKNIDAELIIEKLGGLPKEKRTLCRVSYKNIK